MMHALIPVNTFLGKYFQELAASAAQSKYASAALATFFSQRFHIQANKSRMIIDSTLPGMSIIVQGNELIVSASLHNHPNITVVNSMENTTTTAKPRNLYTPALFSSMAYLVCQNHTVFRITGPIDEPIYITYKSDFETFYNSVTMFDIATMTDVEIVEEFESRCAINAVTTYIVNPASRLNLSTFYKNQKSALSFYLRNVIVHDDATYNHMLLGKGSSKVLDETKLHLHFNTMTELLGCVDPGKHEFHTVLSVMPVSPDYKFFMDHRHVVTEKGRSSYTPVINGDLPADAFTRVSSLGAPTTEITLDERYAQIEEFFSPIYDRAVLDRQTGVERFYNNKTRFQQNH